MYSAQHHPKVINDYLKKEIELWNILGPFSSSSVLVVHINRFGGVKIYQLGKRPLITDLSFPEEKSVKDFIDSTMCSLKYITVDQVAEKAVLLGRGSLITKTDIKSVYRLILVALADCHYLGMRWNGDT